MRIGDICLHDVATCVRDVPAREVARIMRDRHVGDVIVVDPCDGEALPVGIVTDRDLVVQVLAEGVDPELLTAGQLMRGEVVTVSADGTLDEAVHHMATHGVGRLPVVDAHCHIVGVLTANEAARLLAQQLVEIGRIGPRRIESELESAPAPGPCHWPPRR